LEEHVDASVIGLYVVALFRDLHETKALSEDALAKIEWENCVGLLGLG